LEEKHMLRTHCFSAFSGEANLHHLVYLHYSPGIGHVSNLKVLLGGYYLLIEGIEEIFEKKDEGTRRAGRIFSTRSMSVSSTTRVLASASLSRTAASKSRQL
jgi:hypothetical protein